MGMLYAGKQLSLPGDGERLTEPHCSEDTPTVTWRLRIKTAGKVLKTSLSLSHNTTYEMIKNAYLSCKVSEY